MKLIATADLHYNITRSAEPTRRLAAEVCREGGDALVLVGDTCGPDLGILRQCLELFDAFPGRRMLVAGNHDLWTDGRDSLVRYESEIPEVCSQAGFHYLDHEPLIVDGVGFVGSVGWYDYTFRPAYLKIPLRFYKAKIGPGAAARMQAYLHLLDNRDDITHEMLSITTRWMDGEYVHLPMSDLDFTRLLVEKLKGHLQRICETCQTVVAAVHHLSFPQLAPQTGRPSWDFGSAFMGSEVFGELFLGEPKVKYVFCGHSHKKAELQIDHLSVCNIGSTYVRKRYKVVYL